jgi:hypothetical protein
MADISGEVCRFVADELGVATARLAPATRLFHDLGCDGDDAYELFHNFRNRFEVDLTGFRLSDHFGPEAAFNPFLYLYWRIFTPQKLRFVPVTVGDLISAAETKKWPAISRAAV